MVADTYGPSVVTTGTVCTVVVTYNPELGLLREVLVAALDQSEGLVLVDNGSKPASVSGIRSLVDELRGTLGRPRAVREVYFASNRGLPVAFNTAIEFARSAGFRFVMFLDHDSVLEARAIATLVAEFDRLGGLVPLGALEAINDEPLALPTDDFLDGYFQRRGLAPNGGATEDFLATNSGLFVPTAVFETVGGFDDTFFLDAVDFEFGLRLRSRGLHFLKVPSSRIRHRRGEPTTAASEGRGWKVRWVQPARHYYVARDVFRTWRRYHRQFPLIGLLLLTMPLRETLLVLLFYRHRLAHLRCLGLGVLHGLENVGGPMPQRSSRPRAE